MLAIIVALGLSTTVYGAGEFSVIHKPSSIIFRGHDALKENTLPEVYVAALGFTTKQFSHWQGLSILDPFNMPEAIVTIAVDGVPDIGQSTGHHFPLLTNADEISVYESLARRINERFPNDEANLVRVDLLNELDDIHKYSIFDGIKSTSPKHVNHKYLKLSVEEDRSFLKDVALLNRVAEKIESGDIKEDYVPDVYWFRISSLHALTDLHGANSSEAKEAKQLLQDVISGLRDAFVKRYNDRVLVTVLTSDASHTRLKRDTSATASKDDPKTKYNLASKYSKEFPAIFNIILWFCVVMLFAILAICFVTANMDPGRDSIIYRMTSTRMKKDN